MADFSAVRALTQHWWVVLLRGILAILFGVMAYAWPGVTLTFDVSGPGQVVVSGKKVKRKSKHAAGAGSVTLAIVAKGKALKQLNQKGKVKVKVTVTFTPDGGDHAATNTVSVTLKKKPATSD